MRNADQETRIEDEYEATLRLVKQQRLSGQSPRRIAFDPIMVGKAARQFMENEREQGRTVSATAAVAHVLQGQRLTLSESFHR